MYPRIVITQLSSNKLARREYTFVLMDNLNFELDAYTLAKRETPRKGFKNIEIYNRLRTSRGYSCHVEHLTPPPIPKSVIRDFEKELLSKITLKGHKLWETKHA